MTPPPSDAPASAQARARGNLPGAVLFACNLNTIRSPMAAGLMRKRFGSAVSATSCGVWEGGYLDPFMIQVMEEVGVAMADHRPRTFEEVQDWSVDLIVALTQESRTRALEATRTRSIAVEFWPMPDPTAAGDTREARLDAYRAVRDHLAERIAARF